MNNENSLLRTVRTLDGIILLFVLLVIISSFSNFKLEDTGSVISKWLLKFKDYGENPYSIFSLLVFIIVFYSAIYLVRIPMTRELKPISVMIIESIAILLFIVLLIFDFFKYILKIDLLDLIIDALTNFFETTMTTSTTASTTKYDSSENIIKKDSSGNIIKKDSSGNLTCPSTTEPTDSSGNEVFNIRNNIYTYDEAQSVCSIYGAKLATYDQIEQAYNDGAEWCNYGWSDGQMALFPTQKESWKKLQKTSPTKNKCGNPGPNHACGRPGINGGHIKNKHVRFGVNCYGKKPLPSENEKQMMAANIENKIPESAADIELKTKMEIWKQNASKFLVVNSFNKNEWSEY